MLGYAGAVLWLALAPLAAVRTLGRRDQAGLVLVAHAGVLAGFVFQTVVLDPRLLYAYPMRVMSAFSLALSAVALRDELRRPWAEQSRAPAAEGPPAA